MVDQEKNKRFVEFFGGQYRKLVGYFRARFGDLSEMEVEDIVSDLMADLFDRTDLTDQVENIAAYIYRSVRNKAIDYLRRRKRMVSLDEAPGEDADRGERPPLPEARYEIQAEIDAFEIRRRLAAALDALEPDQRAVWIATEIDGHSFSELAELWDLPVGTLLSRKHRAVAALQKKLQDLKN